MSWNACGVWSGAVPFGRGRTGRRGLCRNFTGAWRAAVCVRCAYDTDSDAFLGYVFAAKVLKLSIFNTLGSICGGMTSTPALGTLIRVTETDERPLMRHVSRGAGYGGAGMPVYRYLL